MKKSWIFAVVLLIPFFLFFAIFKLLPIIFTSYRSIFEIDGGETVFIGFKNYSAFFQDSLIWKAAWNTFAILIIYVFIKIPLIIIFGTFISTLGKIKKVYLKLLYLPALVGMFAYAIIYRYLFSYDGVINSVLYFLFHFKINWFGQSFAARSVVAFALLWSGFGISLLMTINAISTIPKSIFEYALLEGANLFVIIQKIIIPYIIPVLRTILFYSIIETIGLVDVPMNLTGGAPEQTTVTLGYYLYVTAFDYWNFSYSAAIGIIMFIVIFVLSLLFTKRNLKNEIF